MLTRNVYNRALRSLNRGQTRQLVDYLAAIQKPTTGAGASTQSVSDRFTWEFLDYYKKHEPEKAAEYEKEYQKSNAAEQWLSSPTPNAPKLDFAKHKTRIADPSFVDKLEVEYKAVNDYWSKWTKYSQTAEWKPAGWAEESQREYSFEKVEKNEKDVQQAKVVQAQELMEKHRELLEEIKLDYEQLEAERDLFNVSENMVQFGLHPQLAEMQEETAAGKQTFHDFLLGKNLYARYVKHERLAQAQNENRRQIFLERYKQFSHLRGYESA